LFKFNTFVHGIDKNLTTCLINKKNVLQFRLNPLFVLSIMKCTLITRKHVYKMYDDKSTIYYVIRKKKH